MTPQEVALLKRPARYTRAVDALLLALLVTPLITCGSLRQGSEKVYVRYGRDLQEPKVEEISDYWPELKELDQFAVFSANAYRVANAPSSDDCKASNHRLTLLEDWGWKPFTGIPLLPVPSRSYKIKGLSYEVWEKTLTDGQPLVLIAFRGTEPTLGDWYSNLRWLTRFIPFVSDQYDQVRSFMGALVEYIRTQRGANVKIVTTGHSLGGGLAQQAAYASEHVKWVYAFHPSPVTGFFNVPRKVRSQTRKGINVFRVFEHGEALSFARLAVRRFNPNDLKDPRIVEARYDLITGGTFVSEHSIKEFACRLRKKLDESMTEVDRAKRERQE